MTEFTAIDLTGQVPGDLICTDCAANGRLHIATFSQAAYCGHRSAGVFRIGDLPWWRMEHITREDFNRSVALAAMVEEDRLAAALEAEAKRAGPPN